VSGDRSASASSRSLASAAAAHSFRRFARVSLTERRAGRPANARANASSLPAGGSRRRSSSLFKTGSQLRSSERPPASQLGDRWK